MDKIQNFPRRPLITALLVLVLSSTIIPCHSQTSEESIRDYLKSESNNLNRIEGFWSMDPNGETGVYIIKDDNEFKYYEKSKEVLEELPFFKTDKDTDFVLVNPGANYDISILSPSFSGDLLFVIPSENLRITSDITIQSWTSKYTHRRMYPENFKNRIGEIIDEIPSGHLSAKLFGDGEAKVKMKVKNGTEEKVDIHLGYWGKGMIFDYLNLNYYLNEELKGQYLFKKVNSQNDASKQNFVLVETITACDICPSSPTGIINENGEFRIINLDQTEIPLKLKNARGIEDERTVKYLISQNEKRYFKSRSIPYRPTSMNGLLQKNLPIPLLQSKVFWDFKDWLAKAQSPEEFSYKAFFTYFQEGEPKDDMSWYFESNWNETYKKHYEVLNLIYTEKITDYYQPIVASINEMPDNLEKRQRVIELRETSEEIFTQSFSGYATSKLPKPSDLLKLNSSQVVNSVTPLQNTESLTQLMSEYPFYSHTLRDTWKEILVKNESEIKSLIAKGEGLNELLRFMKLFRHGRDETLESLETALAEKIIDMEFQNPEAAKAYFRERKREFLNKEIGFSLSLYEIYKTAYRDRNEEGIENKLKYGLEYLNIFEGEFDKVSYTPQELFTIDDLANYTFAQSGQPNFGSSFYTNFEWTEREWVQDCSVDNETLFLDCDNYWANVSKSHSIAHLTPGMMERYQKELKGRGKGDWMITDNPYKESRIGWFFGRFLSMPKTGYRYYLGEGRLLLFANNLDRWLDGKPPVTTSELGLNTTSDNISSLNEFSLLNLAPIGSINSSGSFGPEEFSKCMFDQPVPFQFSAEKFRECKSIGAN